MEIFRENICISWLKQKNKLTSYLIGVSSSKMAASPRKISSTDSHKFKSFRHRRATSEKTGSSVPSKFSFNADQSTWFTCNCCVTKTKENRFPRCVKEKHLKIIVFFQQLLDAVDRRRFRCDHHRSQFRFVGGVQYDRHQKPQNQQNPRESISIQTVHGLLDENLKRNLKKKNK